MSFQIKKLVGKHCLKREKKNERGKWNPAPISISLPISHNDSKGDQRKGFKLRLFW